MKQDFFAGAELEEENHTPTRVERAASGLFLLFVLGVLCFGLAALLSGCIGNKGSHQNGIVLYCTTSGQIGIGYGETEDIPGGCTFRREKDVWTATEANWLFGATTNYTRTLTEWDTRGMVTNGALAACACTTNAPAACTCTPNAPAACACTTNVTALASDAKAGASVTEAAQ